MSQHDEDYADNKYWQRSRPHRTGEGSDDLIGLELRIEWLE